MSRRSQKMAPGESGERAGGTKTTTDTISISALGFIRGSLRSSLLFFHPLLLIRVISSDHKSPLPVIKCPIMIPFSSHACSYSLHERSLQIMLSGWVWVFTTDRVQGEKKNLCHSWNYEQNLPGRAIIGSMVWTVTRRWERPRLRQDGPSETRRCLTLGTMTLSIFTVITYIVVVLHE